MEGTLAALKACRRELIDPKITEHRGRIVKTTGDGALVEFASAVDAVRCAVEIQRGMVENTANASKDRLIEFRIGINVGDIIIDEGDIYDDGVNIAARIEAIAEPGGISISEDAWRQVQGKVEANFVDAGEQILKNIARPVRVYRLDPAQKAASASKAPPPTSPQSSKSSIAVLAFNNMSGDPEQEYFSDGISEDIITDLSKLSELRVIARNSTFTYKGEPASMRLDPLYGGITLHFLAEAQVSLGQFKEAVATLTERLKRNPNSETSNAARIVLRPSRQGCRRSGSLGGGNEDCSEFFNRVAAAYPAI
jgi:adenylate cyclase